MHWPSRRPLLSLACGMLGHGGGVRKRLCPVLQDIVGGDRFHLLTVAVFVGCKQGSCVSSEELQRASNCLNRSTEQPDLYPFVLSQEVIGKLGYVDALVHDRLTAVSDRETLTQAGWLAYPAVG